jgi:hypothetical protein
MELLTLSKLMCYFENIVIDFNSNVVLTGLSSNLLEVDLIIIIGWNPNPPMT